jgi:hypothetical protein
MYLGLPGAGVDRPRGPLTDASRLVGARAPVPGRGVPGLAGLPRVRPPDPGAHWSARPGMYFEILKAQKNNFFFFQN